MIFVIMIIVLMIIVIIILIAMITVITVLIFIIVASIAIMIILMIITHTSIILYMYIHFFSWGAAFDSLGGSWGLDFFGFGVVVAVFLQGSEGFEGWWWLGGGGGGGVLVSRNLRSCAHSGMRLCFLFFLFFFFFLGGGGGGWGFDDFDSMTLNPKT